MSGHEGESIVGAIPVRRSWDRPAITPDRHDPSDRPVAAGID